MTDNSKRLLITQRKRAVALIVWLSLIFSGCGTTATSIVPTPAHSTAVTLPPAKYAVQIQQNVAYGPLPEQQADICIPQNTSQTRPAILLIHGGGWTGGSRRDFGNTCQFLASQGFVTVEIDYRLAPAHIWPAQLVDVQLAVRAIRDHARDYGIDPQRICAYGSSAGGQLAVFLGALVNNVPDQLAGMFADQSPLVECVVDEYGPVDLTSSNLSFEQQNIVNTLLTGSTAQASAASYHDASPIFALSAQTAPMFVIQGKLDTLVPYSQSVELDTTLQRNHVAVTLVSYDGGHAYSGISADQGQRIKLQAFAFIASILGNG